MSIYRGPGGTLKRTMALPTSPTAPKKRDFAVLQYAKVIKLNSVRQTNNGTFLIYGSHKSFNPEFKERKVHTVSSRGTLLFMEKTE